MLLQTRGIRAVGDGIVSVVLATYLATAGLTDVEVGLVITLTLLGSAALTLAVGPAAQTDIRAAGCCSWSRLLMMSTGLGFAVFDTFWPLALVGLIGTLNPSGGDVSVFLPTEQALLPSTVDDQHRTALFAIYSLIGTLGAAVGALLAGCPSGSATSSAAPPTRRCG